MERRRPSATQPRTSGTRFDSSIARSPRRSRPASVRAAVSLPRVLVVGPDARWLRSATASRCIRRARRAAVLVHLVRLRLDAPGRAIFRAELFAAGWPGERIAEHAAANRVHVTLTKLRKLGLAGLLQSRDDGFLLDASVVVVEAITGEPPLGPALKSCD